MKSDMEKCDCFDKVAASIWRGAYMKYVLQQPLDDKSVISMSSVDIPIQITKQAMKRMEFQSSWYNVGSNMV